MINKNIFLTISLALLPSIAAISANRIFNERINTLQTVVNENWLSPAIMELNGDDVLYISFDEMSHNYHRLIYHIDHCEADWSTSTEIFENDFLEGFNDNPIEDYQNSLNTNVLYTHYQLSIPNDRCRIKMSGNYRVTVYDEDNDMEKLFEAEFMVVEPLMTIGLEVTTNTDIDVNKNHQQLSMNVNYGDVRITNPDEQIWTVVAQNTIQNNRTDNIRVNVKPNMKNGNGLVWSHNRELIFDGGNEYRKYEVLSLSHSTMGIDRIDWDGHNYQAYPFMAEPRFNYLYDEDANGAFYIRNSDNIDNDYTCEYVYVNYRLKSNQQYNGRIIVNGQWTNDTDISNYTAEYDATDNCYKLSLLQKQGYYSYQFLLLSDDGKTGIVPSEGNFFQTENYYRAYVYYKPDGGRTWRLVGYQQLQFK